jgi:hypothetical protein
MSSRAWIVVAAIALAALIGWGVFHPEFRPDPALISPALRQELAKTGFEQTRGIKAARFANVRSNGEEETGESEQQISPLDGLVTEKRSLRRAPGETEQTSGLYVGPFAVVSFNRTKHPIVGDLLPYLNWASTHMTRFVVEQAEGFPRTKGGKLLAKVTYEDRHADGKLAQTENRRLRCEVTNVVDAATVVPKLAGQAARIACEEVLESDGRKPANPQTWSLGRNFYSHWYIFEHHWSIASEGTLTFQGDHRVSIRKWTSTLISFEAGN